MTILHPPKNITKNVLELPHRWRNTLSIPAQIVISSPHYVIFDGGLKKAKKKNVLNLFRSFSNYCRLEPDFRSVSRIDCGSPRFPGNSQLSRSVCGFSFFINSVGQRCSTRLQGTHAHTHTRGGVAKWFALCGGGDSLTRLHTVKSSWQTWPPPLLG